MPTYGSGNNKEYLVHVIAVLRLVEQKGTAAEVKEAFAALVKVRKEMSPFFNFPEDDTPAEKEARKKKLADLNESLKAKKSFAVDQAQKAYKLFRCFIVGKVQTQWDCIVNKNAHEESLDWRQRQTQQGNPCKVLDFFHGLHQAPQAHCLPC
jgi:hypothetical protein